MPAKIEVATSRRALISLPPGESLQHSCRRRQRLKFHQTHSAPVMEELHQWMEAQFAEHKTEPNSGLGKAISYLLRHWTKLTLFLYRSRCW